MKTKLKRSWLLMLLALFICLPTSAAKTFVNFTPEGFVWIQNGKALPILIDKTFGSEVDKCFCC